MPHVTRDFEKRDTGHIARVTLDFGGELNIIGSAQMEEFARLLIQLRHQDELRAVVITGKGPKAFIGGADIHEMAKLDPHSAKAFITDLHGVCQGIRNIPVPVIARISGYCLGGGLEVAAACDLRVASEGSIFGMPEVLVGIPSVIDAALLPTLIGWGRTRELVFTGRMVGHEEAFRMGLVERVVPGEQLDEAVNAWLDAILSAGPEAIRLQKSLIREWESRSPDAGAEHGIRTFEKAYLTDEPRAYMERFINRKRKA